jgi:pimeloyl-ACP methyl ester carboxylesterase
MTDRAENLASLLPGSAEFVDRPDGARIHCIHAGRGPAVVLAHGYLLDSSAYNLVFASLVSAGHHVIAFDQRAHGGSTAGSKGFGSRTIADDYRAVLEHFEVEESTFVAHSMGAFFAVVFCLNHPSVASRRVSRLVLLGGNAGAVARGSMQNRLQIPLLRSGALRKLWQMPRLGRKMVSQLFGPIADPRLVEATRLILLRQREQLSWPMLSAMIQEDHYARLGEIPIETRVICGDKDRTCPPWHSQRLSAALPNAQALWLKDVGHMLMFEAPSAILNLGDALADQRPSEIQGHYLGPVPESRSRKRARARARARKGEQREGQR